jgi:hypothetical protein
MTRNVHLNLDLNARLLKIFGHIFKNLYRLNGEQK